MEKEDGYVWKVQSPYLLTLTYDHHRNGANYLGAVLFRSNGRGETKEPAPAKVPLER